MADSWPVKRGWRPSKWRRWLVGNNLGRFGEWLAKRHLKRRGFAIVGRNVRMERGEIDLLAVAGDLLVICEVRTRGPGAALAPELSVDAEKQRHIRLAADEFLRRQRVTKMRVRFDVIAIEVDDLWGLVRFAHYERAFEPHRRGR